jgi:FkbM family methyltransferase
MRFVAAVRWFVLASGLKRSANSLMNAYARVNSKMICVRGGITYVLDLSEAIDRAIYFGGWEPDTIRFLRRTVHDGDVIIEVGANVGAHTLMLANLVGQEGLIYAFEPTTYAQSKLRVNLARNPTLESRVIIRSELVTNHDHSTPRRVIKSSFPIGIPRRADEDVSAIAIALDDVPLPKLDIIKIDVDGYDFKVLEGATGLLQKFKPLVLIELCEHTLKAQGDSIRDIFGLLNKIGYEATYEDGRPIRDSEEVLAIVGTDSSINGVFLHSGTVTTSNVVDRD